MKTAANIAFAVGIVLISPITALSQTPATMSIERAVEVSWQAEPDRVYQLQTSPDLAPDSWLNLCEPFLGDRVASYTALVSQSAAFLRVMTLPQPLIVDPSDNLRGDPGSEYPDGDGTRGFMDIVACTVLDEGTNCAFTVQVAAPFPSQLVMTHKRFDFIFFVDADRNQGTGQSAAGNDYNIHLYLQENGWGAWWGKVTPAAENDGIEIDYNLLQFRISGDQATLVFPKYFLPTNSFEMWMTSHNGLSQEYSPPWMPFTEHPQTARGVFEF